MNLATSIGGGLNGCLECQTADSIIDDTEANQTDLIAMCTHGRTGRMRWTLGSVADRVLRAGHIPILLVQAR